jgi:carboxylesterase type B
MRTLRQGLILQLDGRENSVVLSMPGKYTCRSTYWLDCTEYDLSNFSAVCYGTGPPPAGYTFSEDCLTLNVIRPSSPIAKSTALPVVIWIHGGGFWGGSATDTSLNGSYIGT